MAKHTTETVRALADEMRHAKSGRPFALLTGAGCSISAGIPLVPSLLEEMNHPDNSFEVHLRSLQASDRNHYGKCMSRLPTNIRKDLLTPYLDNAKVNWGHIAIAAMMKAGYIGRVLTFNFDNILSRACGLCGEYPAIYDFVTGVSKSTDHITSPCIIHLHGQGTGLSMLNSEEETQRHADNIEPLLRDTINESPLMVIGYSGNSDKVFTKITELYNSREKLHWCDYEEEPAPHVSAFLNQYPSVTTHHGKVDSDLFLVKLAQELGCFPPPVFGNPLQHLRDEIKDVCEFRDQTEAQQDVLKNLHEQLNAYESSLAASIKPEQKVQNEAYELVLKNQQEKILEKSKDNTSTIPPKIYASALHSEAIELSEKGTAEPNIELLKQALGKYQKVASIRPKDTSVFYNWALALQALGEQSNERQWFEQACEKYAAAITIKPDMHEAFNNWGLALQALGEQSNERQCFKQAFDKYAAAVTIKPDMHEAFNNWGIALQTLGEQSNERQWFDQAFEKYAAAIAIKPDKYEAFNNWASALITLWHINKDGGLLIQAEKRVKEALALNPSDAYNAACLAAVQENDITCEQYLTTCLNAGTLPSKAHLETDVDLKPMHEKTWFIAFMNKLSNSD